MPKSVGVSCEAINGTVTAPATAGTTLLGRYCAVARIRARAEFASGGEEAFPGVSPAPGDPMPAIPPSACSGDSQLRVVVSLRARVWRSARLTVVDGQGFLCRFCGSGMAPEEHITTTGAWVCPGCGYVECLPRPDRATLEELYSDLDYHRFNTDPDALAREVEAHAPFVRRLKRVLSQGASVVEVGAATGALVKAMQLGGLRAVGMDISLSAAQAARELLDVEVRAVSVEGAVYPADTRAIVAFHVLEHLLDPKAFLVDALEALPVGGWLVLEVPDYTARMRGQLGPNWPYYIEGEHLQHFSGRSLGSILTSLGASVRRTELVGGLGLLQRGRGVEGVGARDESPVPTGWRGRLFAARSAVYAVPGGRWVARAVNTAVGYHVLHRNAHVRVWAQKL